jgi:hypothetical protein
MMRGRRLPDTPYDELPDDVQPGDYWKLTRNGEPWLSNEPSNLTRTSWMICTPNGLIGTLRNHTVREHQGGTITIAPGDGSSNSVMVSGTPYGPGAQAVTEWHGYIYDGVWQQLA